MHCYIVRNKKTKKFSLHDVYSWAQVKELYVDKDEEIVRAKIYIHEAVPTPKKTNKK